MIKDKLEAVKAHIVQNKEVYISAGCGIIAGAGITLLVTRGRHAGVHRVPDTADLQGGSVFIRPLSFLSHQNNIVNVIEREGRGHPGYLVQCLETGELFPSQRQASMSLHISESMLSTHLNNKATNAGGYHLKRIELA